MFFKTFSSEAEARAFIAGVEYVNDPTLTARLHSADPCCVILEDEDCDDDSFLVDAPVDVGTVPS
jgi:hypothetical protein